MHFRRTLPEMRCLSPVCPPGKCHRCRFGWACTPRTSMKPVRRGQGFEMCGEAVIQAGAGVVGGDGTGGDPGAYAETVGHRALPNVLPYRVGTPAAFGFAGWNARSLTDNAPDVMFTVASNTPVKLGIGKESVTAKPRAQFPYVPLFS